MKVYHEFKPIYNKNSKVLILGTMPSVKSRELGFYYMHPTNRFWRVISDVFEISIPITIDDKIAFLIQNNIALWDVLKSCDIFASKDSSIRNICVNDILKLINNSNIKYIFTTGKKAHELYQKYCLSKTNINDINLPSTSSANCATKYEELKKQYSIIKTYLDR